MNYSRGNAGDGGEAAPGGLVPVSQQALLGRDPYSIAVPYGVDTTADATPVFGLSLHEYLRILIKRKWLILSSAAAHSTRSRIAVSSKRRPGARSGNSMFLRADKSG